MGGRGGLLIDLNQQGDDSGEIEYGQYVPEAMQTSQTLSFASSETQIPPITNIAGLDTMQVAILYRLRTNHVGAAAEFLGEAGTPLKNGAFVSCTCCGKPEVQKKTLICDVCGLSFHLKCLKLRENQASAIDEWVCLACSTNQGKRHWPLGRIAGHQESQVTIQSNNGSLFTGQGPKVGSGDGLEIHQTPRHGGVMGAAESPSLVDSGLRTGESLKEKPKQQKKGDVDVGVGKSAKPSSILSNNTLDESKTRVTRLKTLCRAKEDAQADTGRADIVESISGGERDSSFTSASALSKDLDDDVEASSKDTDLERQHLQKLKEFLGQQGRSLDGEWSVIVKKRVTHDKAVDVMFFSPDKQKFRSKLEVARFLGVLDQRKDDVTLKDIVSRGRKRDVSQDIHQSDGEFSELRKRRKMETDKFLELQDPPQGLEHQLPLQCMDLRVEALGVIDLRPGCNSDNFVWPVGYRCSWHDGVTGSICISEVVDGGQLPPIFRVTRRSCNVSLGSCDDGRYSKEGVSQKPDKSGVEARPEAVKTETTLDLNLKHVYDEDDELSMLQGTLMSFTDGDLCVSIAGDEGWSYSQLDLAETFCPGSTAVDKVSIMELNCQPENCVRALKGEGDDIGEIVVESTSSSGAWRLLAEQVVKRTAELYGKGSLQLGCKHVESSLLSALGLNVSNSIEGSTQGRLHDAQFFFSKLNEWMGQDRFGFNIPVVKKYLEAKKAKLQLLRPTPPTGSPVCQKVSANFVGDLLQIWEFLCRFSDILGQKEPPSLEDLEEIVADVTSVMDADRDQNKKDVYMAREHASQDKSFLQNDLDVVKHANSEIQGQGFFQNKRPAKNKTFRSPRCSTAFSASNIALLKIALSDLQQMALGVGSDVALESKRGKKKEGEAAATIKKQSASFLPLNDLTWPEVARRYVIGLLTLNTCAENLDISVQERRKILRCIQGDGGVLCGALDGVAAIEADALMLAAAEKQLSCWLPNANDKSNSDPIAKSGSIGRPFDDILLEGVSRKPAWAIVLEPVRKLATNVGARIRNCVRDALEMNPPDWAKEILEHSISKEVYKGNASGPTKRAVLSVLDKVANEKYVSPPKVEKKVEYIAASPALVMKRCRVILRQLITTDDVRVFCNSFGGTVLGYFEKEDDNIEVPLPLVARPLDFRMIDSRLAAESYGDSHESYAADMRQLFQNVPVVFRDREDFVKIGQEMSQRFETLYEEKVVNLVNGKAPKLKEINQVNVSEAMDAATEHSNVSSSIMSDDELQKAPWEEGVCKICGVDKDDDSTLLCDGCDAEYHIYCLEPPLTMIPEGNWYCPSCVALEQGVSNSRPIASGPSRMQFYQSRLSEDGSILPSLASSMDGKDYWHLNGSERVQLLKFLCDKVLESAFIRDHIDQSIEGLPELQQRLRVLLIERQAMKGNHRVDDVPVSDNTEAGLKETLPKKRGRKSLKSGIPTLDECTRIQSGVEFIRLPVENSCAYELDHTVDGKILFQSEPETALGTYQNYGDIQTQDRILMKGSLGLTIQEAQMSSQHPDFDVPSIITAQASGDYSQNPNKIGVTYPEVNVTQIQNGNFPPQELVSASYLGSMQGSVDEVHHSLHATPVSTVRCLTDLAAVDDQKGSSGVLQGWKLEGQTDKGSIPLSSSHLHRGGEVEVSPLPNAQSTPGKTALELLEAEIEKVEIELMKLAPRRDCLGRDDLGRIYWALGWAGKFPWLVVEKGSVIDDNTNAANCNQSSFLSESTRVSSGANVQNAQMNVIAQSGVHEWSTYCDDESIEQLLKWLKPTIASERCLKSALSKWCLIWSSKYKKEPDKQRTVKLRSAVPVSVNTKAATILSKKFGSIPQPEAPGEEPSRKRGRKKKSLGEGKIFRCDCLELVWTTRIHCPCCHHTYDSVAELQGHNHGACTWRGFEDEGQVLVLSKAKKAKIKGQEFHPPDLSLVLKRFTLHTSNRMRSLQIGCLADKGPRFIPAPSVSPLLDPALHMMTTNSPIDVFSGMKTLETGLYSSSLAVGKEKSQFVVESIESIDGHAGLKQNEPTDVYVSDCGLPDKPSTHYDKESTFESHDQEKTVSGLNASEEIGFAHVGQGLLGMLPPTQPLLLTNLWAVKKLKASLLDIESLLSIDIMEPSRSEPSRRRAWRSFVKSAVSILELVQAVTLLEQMVKASCLKESWCNWTHLSAGVGINTLSALALRIYSLDAAIKYKRSSVDPDTEDSEKPNKSARKKKTLGQV